MSQPIEDDIGMVGSRIRHSARAPLFARRKRSQFIRAIVVFVRSVPFRPRPFRRVPSDLIVELFPKIAIEHGLLLRRHPVASFPSVDPLRDAVLEIFRVRYDLYFTTLFQRAEPFNSGCELHPVVCRMRLAAKDFLLARAVAQDRGPSSRSWISQAGAIGDQLYLFCHLLLS